MTIDQIYRENLRLLVSEAGSSTALAGKVGKSPAQVSQWLNGSKDSKTGKPRTLARSTAREIERLAGKPEGWMDQPHGADASNVSPAESRRRVPIISWVQAGSWGDISDPFHPGQADEWALAFDSLPGKSAFALRVVGDSMTNPVPGARSFPEGTIIIVDPGRAANAGDYVIAKDIQTQQATFKLLAYDGGRWFLRPLNPTYPTVEIDDPSIRVIGRVIEYQTRGKL